MRIDCIEDRVMKEKLVIISIQFHFMCHAPYVHASSYGVSALVAARDATRHTWRVLSLHVSKVLCHFPVAYRDHIDPTNMAVLTS